MRIVCVHLLDNFSGSSQVCAQAISIFREAGHVVHVIVGDGGDTGPIRRSSAVETYRYRYVRHPLARLIRYALSQVTLFRRTLVAVREADVVYVSAVLPIGALLAAHFARKAVIVHLHEVGLGSPRLFGMLLSMVRHLSDRIVCVSTYVRSSLALEEARARVVYNSLDPASWSTAQEIARTRRDHPERTFRVALVASLKWYKGIHEFVALAWALQGWTGHPDLRFEMVVNSEQDELDEFLRDVPIPPSLDILRLPPSVLDTYARSSLVLNLSRYEGWIESFGLTLLEAMTCGVPVVSPTTGGCRELYQDGLGGWAIDSRDQSSLRTLIEHLSTHPDEWHEASRNARTAAQRFEPDRFRRDLLAVVDEVRA